MKIISPSYYTIGAPTHILGAQSWKMECPSSKYYCLKQQNEFQRPTSGLSLLSLNAPSKSLELSLIPNVEKFRTKFALYPKVMMRACGILSGRRSCGHMTFPDDHVDQRPPLRPWMVTMLLLVSVRSMRGEMVRTPQLVRSDPGSTLGYRPAERRADRCWRGLGLIQMLPLSHITQQQQ